MGTKWSDTVHPRCLKQQPDVSLANPGADLIETFSSLSIKLHKLVLKTVIQIVKNRKIFFLESPEDRYGSSEAFKAATKGI